MLFLFELFSLIWFEYIFILSWSYVDFSVTFIFPSVLWPCPQYVETISSRQMDMQKFMADGCREALLEEMRRFCFLADKHCMFSYQISNFHQKVSVDTELISQSPSVNGLLNHLNYFSGVSRPKTRCLWSFPAGRKSAATSPRCRTRWRTW